MERLIYKVCSSATWQEASSAGLWTGSRDDQRDGYIHFSTARQLAGTLAKHFSGQPDLVLITFDADALGAALRWEASRNGDLFPHHYGALDTRLAIAVQPLPYDADGRHVLPKELA